MSAYTLILNDEDCHVTFASREQCVQSQKNCLAFLAISHENASHLLQFYANLSP